MDLERFDKCWFAIQVKPRYEFLAASILRGKGFKEFTPSYKIQRQWSDRRTQVELPLFPGYIFCKFNSQIRVPIMTTPGVIRIIGTNMAIPDEEIEAIHAVVANKIAAVPTEYLKIGTRVQVISGPLSGLQGVLLSYGNQHRLILSITLVQNSISVEMDQSNVSPIPESAPPIKNSQPQLLHCKASPIGHAGAVS